MIRSQLNRIWIVAVILVTALFLFRSCVNDDDPSKGEALTVGDSLPTFSVELNTGETVSSSSLKGKVAVIVLFNTSCPDCRAELPVVEELYQKYKDDSRVKIFGIAREESARSIEAYWSANGLTFPWSPQEDRKVYNLFAESVIPRLYIADPYGMITASYGDTDLPTLQSLEIIIQIALSQPS